MIGVERADGQRRRAGGAQPVEQQRERAAPQLGLDVAREFGHRTGHQAHEQYIILDDIGAQRSGVARAAHELGHQRPDVSAEPEHPLPALDALQQQLLEAAVRGLHLHRALEVAAQPAPRVGVGERVVEDRHELLQALLEQRGDQVVAVAEAPVGGAHANARAARHLIHRRVEPARGEDLFRGHEQPGAVARRVGAEWALDDGHQEHGTD